MKPETIDMPNAALTSHLDPALDATRYAQYRAIKRNGKSVPFDPQRIAVALTKAFMAMEGKAGGAQTQQVPARIHNTVNELTRRVILALSRRLEFNGTVHIEDIQDQVELELMRAGEHKIARDYVLYREQHAQQRAAQPSRTSALKVMHADGTLRPLDETRLYDLVAEACTDLADVNPELVMAESIKNLYEGIPDTEVNRVLVMTARTLIEKEPNYTYVAARLLLDALRTQALGLVGQGQLPANATAHEMAELYRDYFPRYIKTGVQYELLSPVLAEFDLERLAVALMPGRDFQFTYLGFQTLVDRYFLHWDDTRFELPQAFFMRVAMGLSLNEIDREARAIEFYHLLSSFDFMSSTPTLFNAGTLRAQLSSCYLSTIPDDLHGIYNAIHDNAMLSKFAGGLGNDWSRVRAMGSRIKGTNGKSQGVVPFMKVANDTLVAVNQGGRRRGSGCAYLETWHLDIEEFLELRKNTGDERRRTHDMNTANWIPDLFMKRVMENAEWTLFSPDDTPDLHEIYGDAFEAAYLHHEEKAALGKIRNYKKISAVQLWRKMLTMLFETGHPWIAFKDPCNIRSPQQHMGVVHSSNLCTEITLNTSDEEIAVCNLGSINLPAHVTADGLDMEKLQRTVKIAMRMLDNVIDINYYSVPQARRSNLRHRPVGLGVMGFQDALYKQRLPYSSREAVVFADQSMEAVSYFTIQASTDLAEERGCYPTYAGSLWSQGVLPIDSLQHLKEIRGEYLELDNSSCLDWDSLRIRVLKVGMRNSNCMAIAPTATISNICGLTQSIEPTYQNLYVKSNLSGEFTVVNPYLVDDLKQLGLWDEMMVNDLKYFDGSVQQVERIPDALKQLYATAFEIDPAWLVEAAARRQKWIDQAQSLNLYMREPSGSGLDNLYRLAWLRGLKTTYYLRSLGATHVEKNTVKNSSARSAPDAEAAPAACLIDDPECEACQ